jgi:hypothetical protein
MGDSAFCLSRAFLLCPGPSTGRTLQGDASEINRASSSTAISISSFFDKNFKPLGARLGYIRTSLFLPGHFIPAPFFNEFNSLPGIHCPQVLKFLFMVRFLHKLSDADRRLTGQDRLVGHLFGSAPGCPTTQRKADDHCNDCPTNEAPNFWSDPAIRNNKASPISQRSDNPLYL